MTQHKAQYMDIKTEKNSYKQKNYTDNNKKRKTPKKITPQYLHNSGLYYLERFAASKSHFITVMLRKVKRSCMYHKKQDYQKCSDMVIELADKFEKCGLINDSIYTVSCVSSLRRKGLSQTAIIAKMNNKGINKEHTIEALEELDNENYDSKEDAEIAAAIKLAKKKRIGVFFQGEEQNIKKSLGIFARAGFSYSTATKVLDISLDDEEMFI